MLLSPWLCLTVYTFCLPRSMYAKEDIANPIKMTTHHKRDAHTRNQYNRTKLHFGLAGEPPVLGHKSPNRSMGFIVSVYMLVHLCIIIWSSSVISAKSHKQMCIYTTSQREKCLWVVSLWFLDDDALVRGSFVIFRPYEHVSLYKMRG